MACWNGVSAIAATGVSVDITISGRGMEGFSHLCPDGAKDSFHNGCRDRLDAKRDENSEARGGISDDISTSDEPFAGRLAPRWPAQLLWNESVNK